MNQKKIKKNVDKLFWAVSHSSDFDLTLLKYAVDSEYKRRNVNNKIDKITAEIDSVINEKIKDK